ncbi:hypothetical protein BDV06DRAFT_217016 [Aspergillus oleicola]
MPDASPSYACEPCRISKLGCDKSRPQCMRCLRRGHDCHYAPKAKRARVKLYVTKSVECQGANSKRSRLDSSSNKRNRVPKACFRCRQLKVKCDREQPCGRCLKADGGKDCRYPAAASVGNGDGMQRDPSVPLWKQRFHTKLHWSEVLENIENLLNHRHWSENHVQNAEFRQNAFSPVENIFGNIGPLHNAPRKTLLSYIPPRHIADLFVKQYLETIEPSHHILDVHSFKEELENFWNRLSAVDDEWLAQLFVILALGSKLRDAPSNAIGIAPSQLFEAAQVCLQRTSFMIRPQMTSIRTMCLFVIYKQTQSASCVECDALWPATGLIVRLAILLGLHSTESRYCHGTPKTVSARNELWATVILIDLRQSLAAGMPVIPPSSDLIAEPLFNIDQTQSASSRENLGFPLVLYDVLPQIFKILELATSPQITLSYSLVATYDRQIRNLLKQYQASLTSISTDTNSHRFQWTLANVFFRRVLLALHSRLYQEPHASTRYPVSYWSSLECSIALLSEQRELWDSSLSSASSSSSGVGDRATARFYSRLFQVEFFLAAVTICFHLVQDQSPLVEPSRQDQGRGRAQARARQTILELLKSCREIWGRNRDASICHSRSCDLIDFLLEILRESEVNDGDDEGCCVESGSSTTAGSGSAGTVVHSQGHAQSKMVVRFALKGTHREGH